MQAPQPFNSNSSYGRGKVAVLYDGAGLARLGLEQAGLECVGFETCPILHRLSCMVGSGNCVLVGDIQQVPLESFDAVWISVPGVGRSSARTQCGPAKRKRAALQNGTFMREEDETPKSGSTEQGAGAEQGARAESDGAQVERLLEWSLGRGNRVVWVSCVSVQRAVGNEWGQLYNATQFLAEPRQNRNLVIGGRYPPPHVMRPYVKHTPGVCPCITATEYKGSARDARRASRFYGRRLTLPECAFHQGFAMPPHWMPHPADFTPGAWRHQLYRALGNSIPVFMARAFADAYARSLAESVPLSLSLPVALPQIQIQTDPRMSIRYLLSNDSDCDDANDDGCPGDDSPGKKRSLKWNRSSRVAASDDEDTVTISEARSLSSGLLLLHAVAADSSTLASPASAE